ncbi:MAG: Trk system potassium transporter TrkA [Clostridia bacterium]|nr:Trk system potassium transporter TrkA [Clostridia bacterium]
MIVGAGKVGITLAERLSEDKHDVTIIDRNEEVIRKASETLDVLCIRGNGANLQTLTDAGVAESDVLIAITGNDELNLICCLAAKQLGCKYTIARIRDPEYTESFDLLSKKLNVDQTINPDRAAALEISRMLRFPFALNVEAFARGFVEMVDFRVEISDHIVNVPLHELHRRYPDVQFTAVQRGKEALIPDGRFEIHPNDLVYVTGERNAVTRFFKELGKDVQRMKSALLIGGGHVSYYLSKILAPMGVRIRLIEIKHDKCVRLADQLDKVTVIHADGTDQETLDREDVGNCGAFICLTDRDEENIMTGLYGKRCGAKKVIVKINRLNMLGVMGDLGLDSIVSPKLATADSILRSVRALSHSQDSVVQKVYGRMDGAVEAYECTALKDAP